MGVGAFLVLEFGNNLLTKNSIFSDFCYKNLPYFHKNSSVFFPKKKFRINFFGSFSCLLKKTSSRKKLGI